MRRDLPPDAVLAAHATHRAAISRAAGVAIVVALVGIIALYASTAASIVGVWQRSDTFAHGFLVVPVAAWLAWRNRAALRGLPIAPWWPAVALMLVPAAAWLVGELAQVNALMHFSLVALLVLTVPAIAGRAVARALAFPLGFLFFAVPFGEFLLPQLMDGTATFTVYALRATGIPVYREGLLFVIPSGTWSVVEACSGVRYLIASVMVGTLFAYLTYRSLGRRLAFVGISLLTPIVANWLRAYLIVVLGHVSNNRLAVGVDHLIYGWIFFGLVMALMFWIGARWQEDFAAPDPSAREVTPDTPLPVTTPARLGASAMAVLAVASLPVLAAYATDAHPNAHRVHLRSLAPAAGWSASPSGGATWRPAYYGATADALESFAKDGRKVGVHLYFYRDQTEEKKLVSSSNMLVRSEDPAWRVTETGVVHPGSGNVPADVAASTLREATGTRLRVWQWYVVDGAATSSPAAAKLYTLKAQLLGRGDDSAAVILSTPMAPEGRTGDADAVLKAFVDAMSGSIQNALRETSETR